MNIENFPHNVFEDINMSNFEKHNKKNVTEDFVSENFIDIGWNVYRPFNDSGIDLVVSKKTCKKGHSKINENPKNNYCDQCRETLIQIIRFIQVKTRRVEENKKNVFGYTLKSKDFRTDPRHTFLFYSDFTNDFLIIPIYEYMKIFYDHKETIGKSHFGNPAFRVGNNKLNSLKLVDGKWLWGKKNISFERFRNLEGLKLISDCKWDININHYIDEITKMRFDLFYNFSKGQGFLDVGTIEDANIAMKNISSSEITKMRNKNKSKLKNSHSDLIASINKGYHIRYGLDTNE